MKCIILLTLVALCYGYPSGSSSGRGIYLNQDGSVSIISANGRRVIIPRGVGQNSADIALAEYQSLNRFGQPQAESFAQIVAQSQGNNIQQVLPNLEQIKIQQGFQSQGNQLQNGNLAQIVAQYQGNGRGVNNIQQVLQAQNQIGQYQQGPVLQRQGNLLLGGNLAQVVVQNQKNAEVNRIQQVPQALGQSQNQLVQGGPINQQAVQQISQLIQQQQGQLQFGSNQQDQINQLVQAYLRSGNIQGQQGIGVINSARVGNLISQLLNSNGQQIPSQYGQSNQYGQQVEQSIIGQLSQIIQEEREVLGRQNQVQQQQLQQQQQQVLLLGQQAQQQQQQQEQQARQQLVQLLQQQVQQDQEEVLQQQILQQQQQQGQNNVLGNLLIQGRYQQGQGYGEQQQGVYSLGPLGVYGQGVSRRNIPLVF